MTVLRKTLECCFQIYNLQLKLKYYLQNLRIFTGKNIAINFKIIIIYIYIYLNKNLLLANTNQTLQI